MWLGTVITKKHERRRGHNASIWSVCRMLFTELKSLKQPDKITWSSEKTHQNADAVSTKEYLYGAKCEVLMSVCNTCTSRIRSRSLYSVYYYKPEKTDTLSMAVAPEMAYKWNVSWIYNRKFLGEGGFNPISQVWIRLTDYWGGTTYSQCWSIWH